MLANRTLLLNIHTLEWDTELWNYSRAMLPELSKVARYMEKPLCFLQKYHCWVAGDQQAALWSLCTEPEWSKHLRNRMFLMNTGSKPAYSKNNPTTTAWKINGKTTYALEGSVFCGQCRC
jgi:glycerol kinase